MKAFSDVSTNWSVDPLRVSVRFEVTLSAGFCPLVNTSFFYPAGREILLKGKRFQSQYIFSINWLKGNWRPLKGNFSL